MRARRLAGIPLAPGETRSLKAPQDKPRLIPVICVEFSNKAALFPAAQYQTLLFAEGADKWSMKTYYRDISNKIFNIDGRVIGPYKLPDKDTDYEGGNNGLGGAHFGGLLKTAFTTADGDIDFGQFDNDGPDGVPNSGDDDGKVDTLFIIHPEVGGECEKAGNLQNIWSHSWHYSEGLGHSAPFETADKSNRVDPETNQPIPGAKILIEDYTIQPGLSCSSTPTAPKIIEIGVFCHEYGHALGLPDLYDRTEPKAECVGCWCLMGSGSYGGDNLHADRPSHMSPWCKQYLGWADVKPLLSVASHSFEPVDVKNRVYKFVVPGTSNLEYFLVEYRRKKGWDEFLHGEGLAIWHIDERMGAESPNWPFAPEDQGQNDSPNVVTAGSFEPSHQLVALIQSDGANQLEIPGASNRGDASDLFKSGDFDDDPTLKKGSRAYSGSKTGLALKGISSAPMDMMKAQVVIPATPLAAPASFAAPAPPALTAEQSESVRFVKGIAATLKNQGVKGLNAADKVKLDQVPNHLLHAAEYDSSILLKRIAGSGRTKIIDKSMMAAMPDLPLVQGLVNSDSDNKITVQFDSTGKIIERVTEISADLGTMTTAADAEQRISRWQQFVSNKEVTLTKVPAETSSVAGQTERFTQNIKVDDKSLPIFGKQLVYYYAGNKLVGVSNSPVESDLQIIGKPGELTEAHAREMVARVMGLPEKVTDKLTIIEGLYIADEQPNKARVATKVLVPAGSNQRDIEVYLDGAGKVLEIK